MGSRFLRVLAAAIALLALAADRPNVVVILIDDLGRNDLGCYGSRYYRTPNLDRLAAEGLRFTDGYAACPVCSPTRAALLTGRYPARLHLTDWLPGRGDRPDQQLSQPAFRQQLPLAETTIAEVLKAAGYVTGQIGKWHLGGEGFEPQRQGFDVSLAGDHTGTPLSYFAPYSNKGRTMPGLEQAPAGEYLTDRLTAEAEKFLTVNRDRPFFLYLAHYAVHTPLRAKADLVAKYPANGKPGEQSNPIYAAMIESTDESVGRVLKKLEELKLSERTLVLFTSDNGGLCTIEGPNTPPTINAPLREGKGYLYEGGIRVSLLAKWPGVIKPGSVSSVPVCSIDFLPTICAACGIALPNAVDGVSILPVLRGEALPDRDLFWHYPHYSNQGGRPGGAIRSGDWKLIEFYEDGSQELCRLPDDLRETRNRIAEQPDMARQLHARLAAWRQAVQAQMMTPNPAFVPNPQAADGIINLPARTARIHGLQVRYEPLPHKNTLGFWTRVEDHVRWDFTLSKPGRYRVEVLQGCGKGQGGSTVEVSVADQKLSFTVEDTGGFQNFKARTIGSITLDQPGKHTLIVQPRTKPGGAVMDLRAVTLRPTTE